MEPCETRGAMGLASSASQPSVAAAMVLSYLITRGPKNKKIEAHSSRDVITLRARREGPRRTRR